MNTPSKLTISEVANLYKKSRATIYKDIKNGYLSRDNDGLIDFSELLRAYGEPNKSKTSKRIPIHTIQNKNTPEYSSEYNENTVQELKNQIHFLKQQLEKAEDREQKANNRIDTLLTLIEMKKPVQDSPIASEPLSEQGSISPTVEPMSEPVKEEKEEQPKRSFWGRLFS
ncbi:plasmid replication DNA-binding protein [Acinetobacter baumannii]|uniref:plasmid replication DNA-binding protein n=1 Tax=Acinetobacter baumannii TaxID=470 RepID=UPI002221A0EB|nr:plasmid replication DNA-binding protein [Acinetobacter baumannii]MCW1473924.1 plasmid replication DNA-binding protein [Acinetobacter baumannii]MDV7431415.1 plasmid replication DNA-binding protein [Acinetobacter baumannii]